MSAITFDYTGTPVTLTIKNVIDSACYKACDAGTPAIRTLMTFDAVNKLPSVKWEYLFTATGKFATVPKTSVNEDGTLKPDAVISDTKADASNLYVVTAFVKYKNTDIKVPAYRTMNSKTLKVGESIKFTTTNKDEIVFYEKVAKAYGSTTTDGLKYTGGELELTIAGA